MDTAYYVRTQRKKPHLSFHIFDDNTGGLKYIIKRRFKHYNIFDKDEKYVGKLTVRLPSNYFELLSQDNSKQTEISYNGKNKNLIYHNINIIDHILDKTYKNKMPTITSIHHKYWSLKFSRKDYKVSTKNCIIVNDKHDNVLEFGKRSNGNYRIDFNENEINPLNAVALAITRFHI